MPEAYHRPEPLTDGASDMATGDRSYEPVLEPILGSGLNSATVT
jgi:hypothetical protein